MEDKTAKSSATGSNQPIALPNAQPKMPKKESVGFEAFTRFLKGGASGLLSGGLLQPFQVIKTSM